jgi:hypothetical protein
MARLIRLPPVPRVRAAGSWLPSIGFRKIVPAARPAQSMYTTTRTAPIGGNGYAQSVVNASGIATVRIGPAGVGTRWYPQQITLATTSGTADTSTCVGYLGPVATLSQVIFTSYSGGGDVIGLAIPTMQPGDLLTCVWSGGKPGDHATLVIVGDQDILSPG